MMDYWAIKGLAGDCGGSATKPDTGEVALFRWCISSSWLFKDSISFTYCDFYCNSIANDFYSTIFSYSTLFTSLAEPDYSYTCSSYITSYLIWDSFSSTFFYTEISLFFISSIIYSAFLNFSVYSLKCFCVSFRSLFNAYSATWNVLFISCCVVFII